MLYQSCDSIYHRRRGQWCRGQKKSPELSQQPKAESPKPAISPSQNVAPEAKNQAPPTSEPPPEKKQTPSSVAEPTATYKPKPLLGKSSGSLLNKLMDEVVKEDNKEEGANSVATQEELMAAWTHYLEKEVKLNSVRAVFRSSKPTLVDEKIIITVPSQYAAGQLKGEKGLMVFLRTRLGNNRLLFEFKIDLSLQPKVEKPKVNKILSEKDTYRLLRDQNPLIDDMVRKLDLGLEMR